ncbi:MULTISPECIES: bifunctional DNA-formamidopyrimidine glycosylase/DNA-(apurinic or apyrimidinic site) lyase [unclassified Roseitalea]|uniref:bifunctional DNA-formamidopyrimidine glycosylase/DNA-(apurinic or apyrimidinic site) lyase n=1 Tax=unclassified Roseitalea TaxID=2639107 RepID=UPI00273EBB88|nr:MULTISPECIES: bifunctional DNA-formamidopyrimidine glycosylase/DNA-(apurinic or apyrimidinic site) lyase [unclassified Roseitalea]
MPELPEVETVRRGLAPAMEGARIDALELRRPDLRFPFPEQLAERVAGRAIVALGRRAKYLTIHLDDGTVVISHLGMSGSYRIEAPDADVRVPGSFVLARSKARAHDHMVFHLTGADGRASAVVYNDPRRFGFVALAEPGRLDESPYLRDLGLEPTGNALSAEHLAERLAGRMAPLKAALLDQRVVAGLGNIYVCEALWRARLSPRRRAGTLVTSTGRPTPRCERLALAIGAVIAEAIEAGGSSLRDYVRADGTLGYFQHSFAVYGRQGEACARPQCAAPIRRIVQSGRSTFYCPSCQR